MGACHNQSVNIQFNKIPLACSTDKLNDTVCYDNLVKIIKDKCQEKTYLLLEHLAAALHEVLHANVPQSSIFLRVKKKPAIENLSGGVVFYFGDECGAW